MQVDLVQTTTRDGVRLDGMLQKPAIGTPNAWPIDAVCCVHGTGGNFYASTLFDDFAAVCLHRGCAVLRVNTRGHDGISTAVTAKGGRRLGAAYEIVDDCRYDLTAWADFLGANVGQRVALVGHSLGAVKCLYAVVNESGLNVAAIAAISPPRLSYSWFCESPEGAAFLDTYRQAEALVSAGEPGALLDVKLPLPFVITASGFVEKYGPDECYNYLNIIRRVRCPLLVTLGALEIADNMAFRGAPDALSKLRIPTVVIADADHFYRKARPALLAHLDTWFGTLAKSS